MVCNIWNMSKLDYLKKYTGTSKDKEGKPRRKKKKLKSSKGSNLTIFDDDVDWRALVPEDKADSSAEDDPEDKPIVAEVFDLLH